MYIVLRLNAGYGKKGNPQRLFLVYKLQTNKKQLILEEIINEEYNGISELIEKYPEHIMVDNFEITLKEYKRLQAKK